MAAQAKEGRSRAGWGVVAALALLTGLIGITGPAQATPNVSQTISGTVIGDDGVVPSYVVINASVPGEGGYGGVAADSAGHFSLTVPGSKTYQLTISAGYFFPGMSGGYDYKTVTVPVDSSDVALDTVTLVRQMACTTKTVVTGSLRVGGTITAAAGSATPADVTPIVTYSWSRLGQDDSGIDSTLYSTPLTVAGSSYTVRPADEGAQIVVQASVTAAGRGTATCPALTTRTVAGALPVAPVATPSVAGAASPAVVGVAKVGKKLTAQASTPGATATYQWLRNGRAVAGATGPTFKVTRASKGKRISVVVTYTRDGYAPVVVTSPAKRIKK